MVGAFLVEKTMVTLLIIGLLVLKEGINTRRRKNYDTCTFHLPRHSSFTIMQDFAKWGRVGHDMAGNSINTTV